jgi:hypothetical protein
MTPFPFLLWWAGYLANCLPPRLAVLLPVPIVRAGYRQLWRECVERRTHCAAVVLDKEATVKAVRSPRPPLLIPLQTGRNLCKNRIGAPSVSITENPEGETPVTNTPL